MKDRPVVSENGISDETLRRFSLGLLHDDQAEQVVEYLEQNPEAAAKAGAIGADSFLRKMIQAGSETNTRSAESTVGNKQEATSAASQPKIAVHDLQLHPELAALSQYRFLNQLGAGGMSLVYLAENLHMGKRKEALKILNESQLQQTASKDRFEQEIAVAGRLSHPNIVAAYSAIKLPSLNVFAMEFVEGHDLEHIVKAKGPLRIAVACGMIRHVAAGLQYAMEMKTVHRDIKPSNLMLTKSGTKDVVKILDFGLAKAQMESGNNAGLTSTNMGMGTPQYMAPEQLLSAGSVDIRADIYSLGCTLYYLLAGRPPFSGTPYEIYHAHQSSEARPLNLLRPDIPVELAAVVAKMMAKVRAKRFQQPDEVFAALAPFLSLKANPLPTLGESIEGTAQAPVFHSLSAVDSTLDRRHTQIENVPRVAFAAREDTATNQQPNIAALNVFVKPHVKKAVKTDRAKSKGAIKWLSLGLVGVTLLAALAMASGLFSVRTPDGTIVFEKLPADADVMVDGKQVTVTWNQGNEQATVAAKPGTHQVEVRRNGIKVEGAAVTVSSDEKTSLVVRAKPNPPIPPVSKETPKLENSVAQLRDEFTNSIGLKLALIPAGTFMMGSPESEQGRGANETQHQVTLSNDFYLGTTEVTQGQWQSVMGTTPWKGQLDAHNVKEDSNIAATYVSWNDALEFCQKLSAKEGKSYRLPTEAEWEYACRGGSTTAYSFGDDTSRLSEYDWWVGNTEIEKYAHEVGLKRPNSYGLFDMHGNVFEWCLDRDGTYSTGNVTDPAGSSKGSGHVFRGGCWCIDAGLCRSACRGSSTTAEFRTSFIGFRVVVESSRPPISKELPKIETPFAPSPDGFTNSVGMKMVLIPAGTFMMGSPKSEQDRRSNEAQHRVTISKEFYIGTTEVTQGQWQSVMGTTPWKGKQYVKGGLNNAATFVSWDDAVEFCQKLSSKEGKAYRLPTEAEWEYACRGGSTTAYCFGDDLSRLSEYGWWGGTAEDGRFGIEIGIMRDGNAKTEQYAHEVCLKRANGYGLFDMHGNVCEWCSDYHGDYSTGSVNDPVGSNSGSYRVSRGGDWAFDAKFCRSASRGRWMPFGRVDVLGFRLVTELSSPPISHELPNVEEPVAQPHDGFTNSIGMKLALIPAGTFMMGSPESEQDRGANETEHRVTLSKDFYLCTTEVTQGQWQSVMATTPWKDQPLGVEGLNISAIYLNWDDAVEFCQKLSLKEGKAYRLPTEAEWEYACRGGSTTAYSFGDDTSRLSEYGWWGGHLGNGNAKTEPYAHEVGLKRSNEYGLFDMHGNVFEWCSDWNGNYPTSSVIDPVGPSADSSRVFRGGSWSFFARGCRSAFRGGSGSTPGYRSGDLGFRVAAGSSDPPISHELPKVEKPVAQLEVFTNSIGLKLALIPAGTFMMGSPESEQGRNANETLHRVTISKDFYLGTTELTQGQWQSVMGTTPWKGLKYFKEGSNFAATCVNWHDAVEFCKKLSEKEGKAHRLPTEAEWEYACRSRTATRYSFGDDVSRLSDYGWSSKIFYSSVNTNDRDLKNAEFVHEVGLKRANEFGLFDMHGNVYEWCSDWLGDYPTISVIDPVGPSSSEFSHRVFRGGSWHFDGNWRAALRGHTSPGSSSFSLGFRVAADR